MFVDAVIPSQIGSKVLRNMAFNEASNDRMLYENLTLIDEVLEQAAENGTYYKKQW